MVGSRREEFFIGGKESHGFGWLKPSDFIQSKVGFVGKKWNNYPI